MASRKPQEVEREAARRRCTAPGRRGRPASTPTSATPRTTSCAVSPSPASGRARSAWPGVARSPSRDRGCRRSGPGGSSGTTSSAGRVVVHAPGTCRCRAGRTWSASAMGTKVGCVMRGRLAEGSAPPVARPSRATSRAAAPPAARSTEGCAASCNTSWSAERRLAPVASGSPVPALRQIERVGAARDLEADAVAGPERVGRRPHRDLQPGNAVVARDGRTRPQTDDAVAQVDGLALLVHVAQAYEEVRVLDRRADVQRGGQRTDHGEVLGRSTALV